MMNIEENRNVKETDYIKNSLKIGVVLLLFITVGIVYIIIHLTDKIPEPQSCIPVQNYGTWVDDNYNYDLDVYEDDEFIPTPPSTEESTVRDNVRAILKEHIHLNTENRNEGNYDDLEEIQTFESDTEFKDLAINKLNHQVFYNQYRTNGDFELFSDKDRVTYRLNLMDNRHFTGFKIIDVKQVKEVISDMRIYNFDGNNVLHIDAINQNLPKSYMIEFSFETFPNDFEKIKKVESMLIKICSKSAYKCKIAGIIPFKTNFELFNKGLGLDEILLTNLNILDFENLIDVNVEHSFKMINLYLEKSHLKTTEYADVEQIMNSFGTQISNQTSFPNTPIIYLYNIKSTNKDLAKALMKNSCYRIKS